MTVSIGDFGNSARDAASIVMDRTVIDVIRTTLLRESGLCDPGFAGVVEAHQLAETVIRDVVVELAHGSVAAELLDSLRDLVDLVASDPETATFEQVRTVALTLRRIIDHAVQATASPR